MARSHGVRAASRLVRVALLAAELVI
jgi:hypothetical protein